MIMKLRMLLVLGCLSLLVSACVVDPYGGGGGYRGGGSYNGGGYNHNYSGGHGDRDYGRGVWRQ
jgi:hypothetical protein